MSARRLYSVIFATLSICLLGGLFACKPKQVKDERVLRVGIIASLSGPARPWGLVSARSAQVIADYHNDRGGFDVGGKKVRLELIVRDDAFEPSSATGIAHDFSIDNVKYVIGPLGDAAVFAASRVLDGAGIFYVHYGFHQDLQSPTSLGVLGMPLPQQSLPVLFEHLREEKNVSSILIMAYGTEEGIKQKEIAEYLATDAQFELVKLSRFDVSEETFDFDLKLENVQRRVERVVETAPDALVLAGCPPEIFVVLVDRLRSGGYEGYICTQNFQDSHLLAKLSDFANGVYYVGGEPADESRSKYYEELKARYIDIAEEWSAEADTKLYALAFILACVREAGLVALEDTSVLYRAIQEVSFEDPFFQERRIIPVIGGIDDGLPRQILTPIRISKMLDGRAVLIKETLNLTD